MKELIRSRFFSQPAAYVADWSVRYGSVFHNPGWKPRLRAAVMMFLFLPQLPY